MTALQTYQCPMCRSLREVIEEDDYTIHYRLHKPCRLCGAKMYNYFVLFAYKGSWVRLMESLFPEDLETLISELKQVKDDENLQ